MGVKNKFVIAGAFGLISLVLGVVWTLYLSMPKRRMTMKLQFGVIVEIILSFCSRFLWNKFSRVILSSHLGNIAQRSIKLSIIGFLTLAQLSFVFSLFFVRREPHFIGYICYASLGIFVQIVTFYLIADTVQWIYGIMKAMFFLYPHSKKFPIMNNSIEKEGVTLVSSYSQRIKLVIVLFCSLTLSIYGLYKGTLDPTVKFIDIPIKGFPSKSSGFKIVQLSDIHVGPTVGRSKVASIVNSVNQLHPDILVIVGDLVDGPVDLLQDAILPLKDIKTKFGKYFVTGNHEYISSDVDMWIKELQKLGFEVLHNSHKKIHVNGQGVFYLAGVDDLQASRMGYLGHGMDLDRALRGCEKDFPIILLAHQPYAAKIALQEQQYNIQLVLSGHTHGGQLFPMTVAAYLFNPFFAGLYHYHGANVYVSQGTVFWGIPMRTFSTAEISHITIQGYGMR